MTDLVYSVGSYLPVVMVLITVMWISFNNSWAMLFAYIGGIVGNSIVNSLLKQVIRQPRPGHSNDFRGSHKYGMPSGHAQAAFFTTGLVWAWTNTNEWPFLYFMASLLIAIQRLWVNVHTLAQVSVGAVVGFVLACMFAYALDRKRVVSIKNTWFKRRIQTCCDTSTS
jgi:membrane-associated phospholipid phosphatase